MPSGEFHCDRPFGIDDGELDDLTPQMVFVLGYELCQVDSLIDGREGFEKTIHVENRDRIESKLVKDGRDFQWMWPSDDVSESWIFLKVESAE